MTDRGFAIGSETWPGTSKLNEECGELIQVIGKLMGTGGEVAHWDGTDLRLRLQEEIADVQAAIDFVKQVNPQLDKGAIERRTMAKHELFWKWHLGG